ncbi:MAG: hypothetical protein U0V70_20970 [Terriglobia bacterium]
MNTRFRKACLLGFVLALILSVGSSLEAKSKTKHKYETINCTAFGQGTQMGQTFSVTIIIQEYSDPSDRQILLDAFNKGGSQALFNAVSKMPSKGHIAITGTVGYDINYVREFPSATSRKIRLVTNRPITFGEVWSDSRSMSYNLSILELDIPTKKGGKGSGTLLPAAELQLDKKTNEISIEAYQNPWRLADVIDWGEK